MAITDLQIATLVEKYLRERDRFDKMATLVARRISAQLLACAIPHVPTFRAKDPESLRGKLTRDGQRHEFTALEREFAPSILDLAGVRILLYRPQDRRPSCDVIEGLFVVPEEPRFRRDYTDVNGYCACHRVVTLPDDILASDPALLNLAGVLCEVQVVTIGDHVWNELNHDILYKTPNGRPSEEQSNLLQLLRGQLNTVRDTVQMLMDATARQREANLTTIETPEDLSDALKVRTGSRLRGDFEQLRKLLAGVLTDLTRAELDNLPINGDDLIVAAERLRAVGVEDPDGVACVIGALWPTYGEDLLEVASSWRGRPGAVARLVQKLAEPRAEGTI